MYVYQSSRGFELDILTSKLNDVRLRNAIKFITGERYPNRAYPTRAEAEAVMFDIYKVMP
jgi:hypothetical protein